MAFGGKQFPCQMPCDHELANEWARCSGKNASYITIVDISWCCSRLARFVQQCCAWTCILVRFSTRNMSQHSTTGWPNAPNMLRPTMLRYAAFKCCDRLTGAFKCLLLIMSLAQLLILFYGMLVHVVGLHEIFLFYISSNSLRYCSNFLFSVNVHAQSFKVIP